MVWVRGFGPGSRRTQEVVVTRTTPTRIIIEQSGVEIPFNRNSPYSGGTAKEIGHKAHNGFSYLKLVSKSATGCATTVPARLQRLVDSADHPGDE